MFTPPVHLSDFRQIALLLLPSFLIYELGVIVHYIGASAAWFKSALNYTYLIRASKG
jgi:hypothetical protein